MFFVASKVFWMFLSPIGVLLVFWRSWARRGLETVGGERFAQSGSQAILILITVGMTPLGLMAAAPLENRFPQPAADMPLSPSGSSFWGVPSTAWRGVRSSSTSASE